MQHFGVSLGHFCRHWNARAWSGINPQHPPSAIVSMAKTRDTGAKHTPRLEAMRSVVGVTSTSSIHVLTAYPDGRLEIHTPDLVR
jgi:hypothetical protein